MLVKYKSIVNQPIFIHVESYYREVYKKLYIYLFKNLYVKFNFLYHIANKRYIVPFLKIQPLTRVYRFYKKKRKKFTLIRAPFVYKKSKEQFELLQYKYLLKTNIIDFYYFLYLLRNNALSRLNIKYKVVVKNQGTLYF